MPQVILPSIRDTDNKELQYQYMYDAYYKLQKELSFLLENLDSDNVVEAQSVIADWVYAGNVSANQITAGTISAQISINSPNIYGGSIVGTTITGGTLTAGTNSKIRIAEYTGAGEIRFTSSSGVALGQLFYNTSSDYLVLQNMTSAGRVAIFGDQRLDLSSEGLINISGSDIQFNGDEIATKSWVSSNFSPISP